MIYKVVARKHARPYLEFPLHKCWETGGLAGQYWPPAGGKWKWSLLRREPTGLRADAGHTL